MENMKTSKIVKKEQLSESTSTGKVKLSIVVPCCNVEAYLDECLSSIVNQTFKDIEIICVNDGSKDNTLGIIQSYAAKDSRIKIIDKPNSGYGDSMNKGFAMATGEYIGIVESDDFIEPGMFEKLYETAIEYEADVVKSNFWFYWSNPEKNELHEYFKKEECNKVIRPYEYDNGSLFGRKPSIWSAIYKKTFLDENEIGFLPTPGASFQDTSFTFKVYSSAERMVCLYDAFLHYRQDNENSSVNNADKKAYCICDEYNEIKKFITEHPESKDKLYPIYGAAFYDTCIWMYERLSTKMRYSFIQDMSEWFSEIIETIGIDGLNFGAAWWKKRDINRIANDPYEYHMWRNVERYEQIGHTFTYKTPITALNNAESVKAAQKAKKTQPTFSVIIPVYNNEKFLSSCLDSILLQTYENIEVICINDGSTDHSLSIMEQYAEIDPRIMIINQTNKGPAETRNVGIDTAIGQYILFLDSDDYYAPNTCERIYKEITKRKNPDAVIFGTHLFPEVPRASDWHYHVLTTPNTYYDKVTDTELLTKPYLKVYSWRCCFKREFLNAKSLRFNPAFKYGEDALFMYEAVIKFKGIAVISDKLYNYRHFNTDSLMNQISKDYNVFTREQMRILKQLLTVSKANGIKPSGNLFQYSCDFIFGCIDNCPQPQKTEYIIEFVNVMKSFGLDAVSTEAAANSQGFWNYCLEVVKQYKKEHSFGTKFKHFISRIIPPSRNTFLYQSTQLMNQINMQQRSIDLLQQQINELQNMLRNQAAVNQKTMWYTQEVIKKYNDDKLWYMPMIIENLEKVNGFEFDVDSSEEGAEQKKKASKKEKFLKSEVKSNKKVNASDSSSETKKTGSSSEKNTSVKKDSDASAETKTADADKTSAADSKSAATAKKADQTSK